MVIVSYYPLGAQIMTLVLPLGWFIVVMIAMYFVFTRPHTVPGHRAIAGARPVAPAAGASAPIGGGHRSPDRDQFGVVPSRWPTGHPAGGRAPGPGTRSSGRKRTPPRRPRTSRLAATASPPRPRRLTLESRRTPSDASDRRATRCRGAPLRPGGRPVAVRADQAADHRAAAGHHHPDDAARAARPAVHPGSHRHPGGRRASPRAARTPSTATSTGTSTR